MVSFGSQQHRKNGKPHKFPRLRAPGGRGVAVRVKIYHIAVISQVPLRTLQEGP